MQSVRSLQYARILAVVVIYGGLLVMFGWFADIQILKSIFPDFVTMKFTAAFSFVVSGLLLLTVTRAITGESELSHIVLPVLSSVLFFLMGILLLSTIFGFGTGIEDLFVREAPGAVRSEVPGRPSLGAMIGFLFVATCGIVARHPSALTLRILTVVGGLLGGLSILPLLGYLIDVPVFYFQIAGISGAIAIHDAALFLVLGIGFMIIGVCPVVADSNDALAKHSPDTP